MFFVCLGDQNMSQLHYQFNDIVKGSVLVELVDFVLHLLSFMIPHLHSVEITPPVICRSALLWPFRKIPPIVNLKTCVGTIDALYR